MKKKIFVTAILVIALCCLLAVGVSAVAYDANRTTIEYTDFDGNTHTVPVFKANTTPSEVASVLGNNSTMQALFEDNGAYAILADSNGELTAFPSWYIIEPKDTNIKYVAISEIEYGFVNTLIAGKEYSKGAIRYIEFPHGMTEVRSNSVFGGSDGMYEVNVTEIHIPDTVSSIAGGAFNNKNKKSQLKYVYIEAGNTISKINSDTFSNCTNLVYIQFENLAEITSIDGVSNCNFTGELDLSKCTKLTSLGGSAFINCNNLTKITLPNSLETIGNHVFSNCKNAYLASPYLPTNLKTIGERFFYNAKSFNNLLIFPEGFQSIGNEAFQDMVVKGGATGNEFNLVFLGKMSSVVYLNGNGHQKHAEKVTVYFAKNSLSDYNKNGFYIKPSGSSVTTVPGAIRAAFCEGTYASVDGKITGIEYIYITDTNGTSYTEDMVNDATNGFDFANHSHFGPRFIKQALTCGTDGIDTVTCIICDQDQDKVTPATGDHKWTSDNNCETDDLCNVCRSVMVNAISHTLASELLYENGYTKAGVNRNSCSNDGCKFSNDDEIPALFTSKGYSLDTKSTAIVLDISVNNSAIDSYKAYLEDVGENSTIVYGVVASINATDDKPLNDDGSAKAGSLSIKFNENNYSNIQTKIMGIKEENYDVGVYCSAYFCINGVIKYISGEEATDVAQKVSYSSLLEE